MRVPFRTRLAEWRDWLPYALGLLFTLALFWLMSQKHLAFNTRTYDFGRFDQAIWNTLHGRVLFTTIDHRSILGNHFSPFMALLSPSFLLWNDPRALLLIQIGGVAIAGLILYQMVRLKQSRLVALLVLIAFYLNPALHDLTLFEFRRVVLAVPFLMLALYGVMAHKRMLMLVALLIALLCKEDMGLFVFGVGVYLILAERDWRWGGGLMVLGFLWALVVSFWIIPMFRPDLAEYPQLFYYDYLGSNYAEIVATLRADPLILPRTLFSLDRLQAIGRVLLPVGLVLPLLSPLWLVIAAPSAALLLFSGDPEMAQLQKWYMAPILPVLFSAVVALLHRHSVQRARWLAIWLLISAVVGFLLFSPLPLGGRYDAALYDVTAHDRVARTLMADISAEASVATQPHYVPHLAHREAIYHYPWVRPGVETLDVVLLDPQTSPYPFTNDELALEINRLLADPTVGISAEVDGIYFFSPNAPTPNRLPLDVGFVDGMQLVGLELAASDADGVLRPIDASDVVLTPGQQLRVGLIWEKVGDSAESPVPIPNDRNVSVRLAAADGYLHAQHDGTPANGLRPTTQWQPGEILRDVHTLTVPDGLPLDQLTLELVVYDWQTQVTVPTTSGEERAVLAPIVIQR